MSALRAALVLFYVASLARADWRRTPFMQAGGVGDGDSSGQGVYHPEGPWHRGNYAGAPTNGDRCVSDGQCPGASGCSCTFRSDCGMTFLEGVEFRPAEEEVNNTRYNVGGCGGTCAMRDRRSCGGGPNCMTARTCNPPGGIATGGGCLRPCGPKCMCCGVPDDHLFFMSMPEDPVPVASCACGPCDQYGPYWIAGRHRYGCRAYMHLCRSGFCVKAVVMDEGPSCYLEHENGAPFVFVSPAVCQSLTGKAKCTTKDFISVSVFRAKAPKDDGIQPGPHFVDPAAFQSRLEESRQLDKDWAELLASDEKHKMITETNNGVPDAAKLTPPPDFDLPPRAPSMPAYNLDGMRAEAPNGQPRSGQASRAQGGMAGDEQQQQQQQQQPNQGGRRRQQHRQQHRQQQQQQQQQQSQKRQRRDRRQRPQ